MKKIILIILFIPSALFAQEFDIESFIESNYGKVEDSTICQMAIDSLTSELNEEPEQGMSWDYGAFYESDEGLIKIYHFSGWGCGAYCNPIFQSIVSIDNPVNNSSDFIEIDELRFELDSIITLKKGRFYLIFGNHSGRPRAVEIVWGKSVVLCSIDEGFKIIWRFYSTTSSMVDVDSPPLSEISFDPNKMTISYRYDWYDYDWYDEMDELKPYRVSGTWKFNGATFEEEEKITEYYKE